MNGKCDVLVLGVTGMLGSTVLKYFFLEINTVFGTIRGSKIPTALENLKKTSFVKLMQNIRMRFQGS